MLVYCIIFFLKVILQKNAKYKLETLTFYYITIGKKTFFFVCYICHITEIVAYIQ
jgi:NADH:ubiquinone oxidoreductase subunit 6 (subunit J)